MKRIVVVMALVLSASLAFAQSTKQGWSAGWDIFNEPLNYQKSSVTWWVNPTTSKLVVTFRLVDATPNKLYEVGIAIFCTTFPSTFGQFPAWNLEGDTCKSVKRQGVEETLAYADVGVVTTDINGKGWFSVGIGPLPSGTYDVEFFARNGAGCKLTGGGGNAECSVDFQSPGPTFGDSTTIVVP